MNYKDFFEKAREKKITNVQIVEKTVIDSTVDILDGKIESYDDYNNIDYSLKAEFNGKTVKLNADYLDDNTLDLIITKCNITDSEYKDDYLNKIESIPKNDTIEFSIQKEIEQLIKLDKIRERYPEICKLSLCFCENYTNTRIINSNNVDISTDSHLCTFVVEAITEKNGDFTSYDEKVLTTDKSKINFAEFVESVIKKTILISDKKNMM